MSESAMHQRTLIFFLIFVTTALFSSEQTEKLTRTVDDYYTCYINNDLLRLAQTQDPHMFIQEAQTYYRTQPADRLNWVAYAMNACINVQKLSAYMRLRTRYAINDQTYKLENNLQAEWPLLSLWYDYHDHIRKLDYISNWIQEQKETSDIIPNTAKIEAHIKRGYGAIARACAILEQRKDAKQLEEFARCAKSQPLKPLPDAKPAKSSLATGKRIQNKKVQFID